MKNPHLYVRDVESNLPVRVWEVYPLKERVSANRNRRIIEIEFFGGNSKSGEQMLAFRLEPKAGVNLYRYALQFPQGSVFVCKERAC